MFLVDALSGQFGNDFFSHQSSDIAYSRPAYWTMLQFWMAGFAMNVALDTLV